jgi:hypothetical protein
MLGVKIAEVVGLLFSVKIADQVLPQEVQPRVLVRELLKVDRQHDLIDVRQVAV